jgi:hypothetical protein
MWNIGIKGIQLYVSIRTADISPILQLQLPQQIVLATLWRLSDKTSSSCLLGGKIAAAPNQPMQADSVRMKRYYQNFVDLPIM